jgi:MFS family permease
VSAVAPERLREGDPGGDASAARWMAVLTLAILVYTFGQVALYPALPNMAHTLHTSLASVSWSMTAYLLAAGVGTPIIGRLGDVYGAHRLLQVVLGLFVAGAVVAAATNTLAGVVAGRVIQGSAAGLFPVCFTIVRGSSPSRLAAARIGFLTATSAAGGGGGLVLGGLLTDRFDYRAILWVVAAMAAATAVLAWRLVPSVPATGGRVDLRGVPALAVGLTLPLVAISEAYRWGWLTPKTLTLMGVGAIGLFVWTRIERRSPDPIADIDLLLRPKVMLTNASTFLVGWGLLGAFILTPQLLEAPKTTSYGFGLTAAGAGLLMLPGSIVGLAGGNLSARLGAPFGNKVPLALGALVSFGGCILIAVDHSSAALIVLFLGVSSAGNSMAFAAMPNLIVETVEPHETGQATGQNAVIRLIGGSVGTAVATAVLASHLGPSGLATDAGFSAAYAVAAGVILAGGLLALVIPPRTTLRGAVVALSRNPR